MPRPRKCRYIADQPDIAAFKPSGVPGRELERIELGLDELEALRLADREGLYQQAAADRMGISRATFSRLIDSARRKVATALLEGKMLLFQGGTVAHGAARVFVCGVCGHRVPVAPGLGRPRECPKCGENALMRADAPRGHGHCRRGRGGGPRSGGPGGHGHGHGRRRGNGNT